MKGDEKMSIMKGATLTITEIELARGFVIVVDLMSVITASETVMWGYKEIPKRGLFGYHKYCGGEVWRTPTGKYIARAYCKECGMGMEILYYINTIPALAEKYPNATTEVDPLHDHSG